MHLDLYNSLLGSRVLVTGATGFIGTWICRRAIESGAVVHAVSRSPQDEDESGVRWEQCDLTDEASTNELVRRVEPDRVIHLAGMVTGGRDLKLVLPMLRANLLATVNLMVACVKTGRPRVVLAGSAEEPDPWDTEDAAHSPYAVAKWGAAGYARHIGALHDLDVAHLRVAMAYGPGQRDLRKLVPYVTVSLLRGESPQLMSGTRPMDWIYVEDVADAFLRASVAPDAAGRSLDIGSGELVTARSLVERLSALIGGDAEPEFGAVPDRRLEPARVADPAPAEAAMGWRPRVSLDDGLDRTVACYRSELDLLPAL